jgi:hypothetical protein
VFDKNSSEVTIQGSRVTINPDRDLDFSNNYEIEIDAGVFKGAVSGIDSVAVTGESAVIFSTVTPSTDRNVNTTVGESQIMLFDGKLAASLVWKDVEGWPGGKTGVSDLINLSDQTIALLMADFMPAPSSLGTEGLAATNVESGNFHLEINGFGTDDLLYMDDLGRGKDNTTDTEILIFAIQASVEGGAGSGSDGIKFNFDPAAGKDGGVLVIKNQTFGLTEWLNNNDLSLPPSDQFVYG